MMTLSPRNQTRRDRASLMRQVRDGTQAPEEIILDPPAFLHSMFVFDFLFQIPGVGPETVRQINLRAVRDQVNLADTLGDLRPAKRQWLVDHIPHRHPRLSRKPQG